MFSAFLKTLYSKWTLDGKLFLDFWEQSGILERVMERVMSLPFAIGDIVEVDVNKTSPSNFPGSLAGRKAIVETMGINWIKIVFTDNQWTLTIAPDMFKKV